MTVLVVGGAGYIGSHVVIELLARGEEVVVLDDLSTGHAWAVPKEAELVVGDFGDLNLVTKLLVDRNVEAILHFAAKIVVPDSVANPLEYYEANTIKACRLIRASVAQRVPRFIFSSTAAVYGAPKAEYVTEDMACAPINPYGRSKFMVEMVLDDVANAYPLTYAVLRYFNVAGADPLGRTGQSTPNATHLIKVAVQAALGLRNGMEVFGTDYPTPDGSCIRDFVQITDLARAHIDALNWLRAGNGNRITCNVGYGHGHSVLEVIRTVKRVTGSNFEVRVVGRREGDAAAIVAENGLIRREFGWTPLHDNLEEIVGQTVAWERRLASRS